MANIDALKPGNQAQNRGFTAAGRAEQRKKFAVINGEIEIGDYRFAIKAFAQTGQFNQRRTRTRLCIQFLTLSRVCASEGVSDAGFVINHLQGCARFKARHSTAKRLNRQSLMAFRRSISHFLNYV